MLEVRIEDGGLTTRLTALSARAGEPGNEVMGEIGKLLAMSVRENFNAEGRPSQWIPSRSAMEAGRKTLTATGRLANSPVVTEVDGTHVVVGTGQGLGKYPIYLNFGTPNRSPSNEQKKFFWFKWFESGKSLDMWRRMALAKTLKGMPARRFNVIQDQDGKTIVSILAKYIIGRKEGISIE